MWDKLNRNYQFRRAYKQGKTRVSPLLVSYVAKNRGSSFRVGVTTSKKTGNAVRRNRSRRIILESFRQLYPEMNGTPVDIVFVARARTPFVKTQQINRVMRQHLIDLGVIK